MKTQLKDGIWIEGLDSDTYLAEEKLRFGCNIILYSGKTSEIPEELAEECVRNYNIDGLYENYKMSSQYGEYMHKSAKESIQSACSQEYCIIYKTK